MLLRLLGVRLSGLINGSHQISLFEDTAESINLYQAIDQIKQKHGVEKLIRANTIEVN
jgi:DNA polymerase IV